MSARARKFNFYFAISAVETMSNIPNTENWKDFLECLKNLPSLWKIKDDIFKDKEEKRKSWETLLEFYKVIDSNATLEDVKKKLIGIKSCYRRELKKIQNSEKSGCGSDEVHVPSLWYFEILDFLKDHEQQTSGLSTIEISDQSQKEIRATEAQSSSSKKKTKTAMHHLQERNELLRAAIENITKSTKENEQEDEADIYGKSWATSFRKLTTSQKIYAKKAVEEIFILGQLNQLTLNTVSTPTSRESSRTSTPFLAISPTSSADGHFQNIQTQRLPDQSVIFTVNSPEEISGSYENFQALLSDNQFS